MKASSKDAGEMKSEELKLMKDGDASDCGDASPKLILSEGELKTSAGEYEQRKIQERADQRKRKIDKAQEEIDIIKKKRQQQSQNVSAGLICQPTNLLSAFFGC